MTRSLSKWIPSGRLPIDRRVREGLRAAIVPVVACALALAGLTAWTSTGAAGSPPQIAAGNGRVLLPDGSGRDTAAFFDITNIGGADDQLIEVTSSGVEKTLLSRRESSGLGPDLVRTAAPVRVPAGGTVTMSPLDLSITTRAKETRWEAGDMVPFVLHFRYSAPVEVVAVVVRPGS
ncbi:MULTISPECIES: copper chaperone PCu(A)C [unclassified Streptomyces]|uniref:copper chaperone PCu(A)C n=1 Tax=unclassified Streptomyces TaxID=2593676 RepID=UPI002E2DB986|nr:copper chaperone PCu(A)C [Streptomyces sp. NBC_01439]